MYLQPEGDLQNAQIPVIDLRTESLITHEQLFGNTALVEKETDELATKGPDQYAEKEGQRHRTQRFPHLAQLPLCSIYCCESTRITVSGFIANIEESSLPNQLLITIQRSAEVELAPCTPAPSPKARRMRS